MISTSFLIWSVIPWRTILFLSTILMATLSPLLVLNPIFTLDLKQQKPTSPKFLLQLSVKNNEYLSKFILPHCFHLKQNPDKALPNWTPHLHHTRLVSAETLYPAHLNFARLYAALNTCIRSELFWLERERPKLNKPLDLFHLSLFTSFSISLRISLLLISTFLPAS